MTIIKIEADDHLLYFFIVLDSCIRGFHNIIRPIIAINDTFLKGKYWGTLFVAVTMNGNNGIHPIAFGDADSEIDTS